MRNPLTDTGAFILTLLTVTSLACDPSDQQNVSRDTATGADTVPQDTRAPIDTIADDTAAVEDTSPVDTNSQTASDATDADDTALPDGPWRSRLYPSDWQPYAAADLRDELFLHDFSWAGYHNSETELATDVPSKQLDVVAGHGADPTGQRDATAAFQQAIDAAEAAGGGVVFVPAGTYRLDGTLRVEASHVVLRGEGPAKSRLFFTKTKDMSYRSHLSFGGRLKHDPARKLAADASVGDRRLKVESVEGLAAGDDVAVGWRITPEFIRQHGMTGTWQAFNGQWQPFFRRDVVAVDADQTPPVVELDVPLRYPALTRDGAGIRREIGHLEEVGVEKLGLANAVGWDAAWERDQVHVLEFDGVKDGWIRQVESFKPPAASGRPASGDGSEDHLQSGGLMIRNSKRVTVADTVLEEAQNRGGGGNGYLFEVRASSEILFRDSTGRYGRHNFIQNWGFGVSGCVWLRVRSVGGRTLSGKDSSFNGVGFSEFHHSLAMANLVDSSSFDDGWSAANRKDYSSGAGHTATQNVLWNTRGDGTLRSWQYERGYVIGTGPDLEALVDIPEYDLGPLTAWEDTQPRDFSEGIGRAADLRPQSLFESQLNRRLKRE